MNNEQLKRLQAEQQAVAAARPEDRITSGPCACGAGMQQQIDPNRQRALDTAHQIRDDMLHRGDEDECTPIADAMLDWKQQGAAEEREACAGIADAEAAKWSKSASELSFVAAGIARAIRQRRVKRKQHESND